MALRSPKHGLTLAVRGGKPQGWIKRINGKPRWICRYADANTADAADAWYERHFADLWQPQPPAPKAGEPIGIADLCDAFMERKRRANLKDKTLGEYQQICDAFAAAVGDSRQIRDLLPVHFGKVRQLWSARFGVHRLYKFINGIRELFKWAAGPGRLLVDVPDYGDEFELPTKADFRRRKKERKETVGLLQFTPAEIAAQLDAAGPDFKAMILLGLNCGYGNTDVSDLPWSVIDSKAGLIDYARGKTGIERRAFLWPETLAALKSAPKRKPRRPEWAGRVFYTTRGYPFVRGKKDQIGMQYKRLLVKLGQYREGLNFYSLRRTFRTIADCLDSRAADLIMGHAIDTDMGGTYVQEIGDERLHVISQSVRSSILSVWLSAARKAKRRGDGKGSGKASAKAAKTPPRHRG